MSLVQHIILAILAMADIPKISAAAVVPSIVTGPMNATAPTINTTAVEIIDKYTIGSTSAMHSNAACYYWKLSAVGKHYSVHALGVADADIPSLCLALDRRRSERGDCEIFGVKPTCQRHPKGGLDWQMEPSAGCSPADIGEIWHDVTHDRFGTVQCVNGPQRSVERARGEEGENAGEQEEQEEQEEVQDEEENTAAKQHPAPESNNVAMVGEPMRDHPSPPTTMTTTRLGNSMSLGHEERKEILSQPFGCAYEDAIVRKYKVWTNYTDPDEIPSLCGGLWDNLKGRGKCGLMAMGSTCGAETQGSNKLVWWFHVALWCRSRDVEKVWHKATDGQYGEPFKCRDLYPYFYEGWQE